MKKTSNTSAALMILIFSMLFFHSCSQDDTLDNLSETLFVRHKNADMPAYIYGNGSEKIFLITLHGGPGGLGLGFRSRMFKKQIEKACAVVYFDQRGSGMAQGSYSEDNLNIDIMAEDVLALVKVIKHKYGNDSRFFLLGHSWGGALGTATLLKDQNKFLGWIEVDGAHNPAGLYLEYITNFERVANEQIALGNSTEYWESVKALILEVDATAYNKNDFSKLNREAFEAEETLRKDAVINNGDDDVEILFDYNIFTTLWNTVTIQNTFIAQGLFRNLNYTSRLSEITIPSLFLWGKYDMVIPATFGQEAFDNIGTTTKKLVIFERSGHSPLNMESSLFAQEVITFIEVNK
jgi:pimeloyl-ACP methyl ester carboxylesterase